MATNHANGGASPSVVQQSESIASLFLFHTDSNVGYAIEPAERLFYDIGLELAGGDASRVHFAFRTLGGGTPRSLPRGFKNVIAYNHFSSDTSSMGINKDPRNIHKLADYARQNGIRLVVIYDIDVVHPLFKALRDAGVRAIISLWGAPISSRMPLWRLALRRLVVRISTSKLDGMIFQSEAMVDFAVYGRGVPRQMVDMVHTGIDLSLYKPASSTYVYDALGFPRHRKVIVYSGHMEARKGVSTLILAAIELLHRRKREDVCFLICGNKEGESRPYEQSYANLSIDKWIRFGGYRSDLPKIFPSCFCGVSPTSGWDSFPRSPIEMAACGLPVIAARLQGLTESVLDQQTGLLFEPGNAEELADRVETLLNRPELAAEYGRRGRDRCERELSREIQAKRLREVFLKRLRLATAPTIHSR